MIRLILLAGSASIAIGAFVATYHWGYNVHKLEHEKLTTKLQQELNTESQKLQKLRDSEAELTQSLTIINNENINGIYTLEKNSREIQRLQDMLKEQAKESGLARELHITDLNHIAGVYHEAVDRCTGLPENNYPYLVPQSLQQSTSQSLAEGIKQLVKSRCEIAVNYNSLYSSYEQVAN